MTEAAWNSLYEGLPDITCKIKDPESEETFNCFELSVVPELATLIKQRYPTAHYVSVGDLEPDGEDIVFELTFFDAAKEILDSGAELTKTKIYWDDEA